MQSPFFLSRRNRRYEGKIMKLAGQVAVIVGSARGIGEAIAHMFSREGASLVLVDIQKAKAQLDDVTQAINRQGGSAIAILADVTDDAEVDKFGKRNCSTLRQDRHSGQQRGIARSARAGARHHGGGVGLGPIG